MSEYETVYGVIKNKDSNDFNNELEYTIKLEVLEKSLEIACKHIENFSDGCYYCPKNQHLKCECEFYGGEKQCIEWLVNYFKNKANEDIKNEG